MQDTSAFKKIQYHSKSPSTRLFDASTISYSKFGVLSILYNNNAKLINSKEYYADRQDSYSAMLSTETNTSPSLESNSVSKYLSYNSSLPAGQRSNSFALSNANSSPETPSQLSSVSDVSNSQLSTGTGTLKMLSLLFQSLRAVALKNPAEAMDGDHPKQSNCNNSTPAQAEERKSQELNNRPVGTYGAKAIKINPDLEGVKKYEIPSHLLANTYEAKAVKNKPTPNVIEKRKIPARPFEPLPHFFKKSTFSGLNDNLANTYEAKAVKNKLTPDVIEKRKILARPFEPLPHFFKKPIFSELNNNPANTYEAKTVKNKSKLAKLEGFRNRRISADTGGLHDLIRSVTTMSLPPKYNRQGSIVVTTDVGELQGHQVPVINLSGIKGASHSTRLNDFLDETNSFSDQNPQGSNNQQTSGFVGRKPRRLWVRKPSSERLFSRNTPPFRFEHNIKEKSLELENRFSLDTLPLRFKHNIEYSAAPQEHAHTPIDI